jgi:transcriptional regulator with XRE-family HTH domain
MMLRSTTGSILMRPDARNNHAPLTGHALRNAHLCERALLRATAAPPLAQLVVRIRAGVLGITRLELARRSGISRGALRDLELGIHHPTRQTLQQFLEFCREQRVESQYLDQLQSIYAGPGATLGELLARLELRAGSSRELARRVSISPTTLWEYHRGNFPLPLALLQQMCKAVGEDAAGAETLWHAEQRRRLLERGLPAAWVELCILCARAGHAESHLTRFGVSNAALRRLRYLELPPWSEVEGAAGALCRDQEELEQLRQLWQRDERSQQRLQRDEFGPQLKRLRQHQGLRRRYLADLFGVGGKKPARIVKHIEEDGLYSAQAYPAGLAAVLSSDVAERERLLAAWQQRRRQFHRRRRPETRVELRLVREMYGFEPRDMEPILGYSSLEYQKIERGVSPASDSAQARIVTAVHQAGGKKIAELLQQRRQRQVEQETWKTPTSVPMLVASLARREGGLIPLARKLRRAGLKRLWPGRLRAVRAGQDIPAWPVVQRLADVCGVVDRVELQRDWHERYRAQLAGHCPSPLGVELRLLVGEVAATLRELSPRLGFNYSVLIREFQRIDRDEPLRWFHIERLLGVLGVAPASERWREIRALWSTAGQRRKQPPRNGQVPH